METNRIIPGQSQSQPPALAGAQGKSGEEAFHDMTKSDGYNKGTLEQAVSERTRLSRTRRADKASRKKEMSLFKVSDDEDNQEAVYRTVMVDGILFTLRLLAVA